MINAFGKKLRIIRIKNGELMKDMANKLNVTSSYLSAVENSNRNIPNDWVSKISELYRLSAQEKEELFESAEQSQESIKINLSSASPDQRELMLSFARTFESLDKDAVAELKRTLKQCKGVKR